MVSSILLIGTVIGIAIFVLRSVFLVVTIRDSSMEPCLYEGDQVLLVKHWPEKWLRKADIVVVKLADLSWRESGLLHSGWVVKRIAYLPGESLGFKSGSNIVSVGGSVKQPLRDRESIILPPHHFYLLGDNAEYSRDSRTWGSIHYQRIVGIVILRLTHQVSPTSRSMG